MFTSFMMALFALVSAAWADCSVTAKVTCTDCEAGQKWQAELYVFAADGSGMRIQVANVAQMESGGTISSGKLEQARRFLDINGAEIDVITCNGDDDSVKAVTLNRDMLGVHALHPRMASVPATPAAAPPSPSSSPEPSPPTPAAADNSVVEEELGDTGEEEWTDEDTEEDVDGEAGDEPSAELPTTPERIAPLPETPVAAERSEPPMAPTPAEPEQGEVVAHNVGWGAAGGEPLWLGNDGDYPSAPQASRRGHFTGTERNCSAEKIPLIQGTAATIAGGIPGQIALDDARATDVAPPDWSGEYVGSTGTTILGTDAAGIFCVEPNSIIRREPAAMAADIPPPAPAGVSLQDLDAMADRLREELAPEPQADASPATVAAPAPPLLGRWGVFTGVQWSAGQPNFHWLAGGFVSLRLSDRIWFEPWAAAGTDGKSTHPQGWDEELDAFAETSGTYLAVAGGASFPVMVLFGDQVFLFSPSFGWVGDDLTAGVNFWGDTFSAGAQAEWVLGRFSIYAQAQVGANAWTNVQVQHRWAFRVPLGVGVKVSF